MKTVVKLTQQSVIGEIENVLDTYPYHPYQQAFAVPELRQELITFVLNRLPCFYSAMSEGYLSVENLEKDCLLNQKLPRSPLEQQLHLQKLIHEGIYAIYQQKSDWISRHLCATVEAGYQPSHWFG